MAAAEAQAREVLTKAKALAPHLPGLMAGHLRRASSPDISTIRPTEQEMPALLATAPDRPKLHSLLCWRRSLLVFAAILFAWGLFDRVALSPWTMRGVVIDPQEADFRESHPEAKEEDVQKAVDQAGEEFVKGIGSGNHFKLNLLLLWLPAVGAAVGFFLLIRALQAWADSRRTRRLTLLAWTANVAPYALVMILPLNELMSYGHLPTGAENTLKLMEAQAAVKTLLVSAVLVFLAPLLLGLALGALRGSLAARFFAPASAPAGWLTLCIASGAAVVWMFLTAVIAQTGMNGWAYLAVLFFAAAPLSVWKSWRALASPMSEADASTHIRSARLRLAICNGVGVLCLIILAKELKALELGTFFTMAASTMASILLAAVLATDWILVLLRRAHQTLKADSRPDGVAALEQLDRLEPGTP